MNSSNLKAILVPGNGGGTMQDGWLPYAKRELEARGLLVIAREFPDPVVARGEYWLPFLHDVLQAGEHTILIGTSSGAIAAMRYAEQYRVYGSVLVGVYYTDLGDANEKASGYFDKPWDWERIKANQNWIIQFASTDDPYISIAEAHFVRDRLNTDYHEFTNRGHFMIPEFPELVEVVRWKTF